MEVRPPFRDERLYVRHLRGMPKRTGLDLDPQERREPGVPDASAVVPHRQRETLLPVVSAFSPEQIVGGRGYRLRLPAAGLLVPQPSSRAATRLRNKRLSWVYSGRAHRCCDSPVLSAA
jgi:hypothetical protein